MNKLSICVCALGALCVASADARLFVGTDDFGSTALNAWEVDVSDSSSSLLWGGGMPEVWGMSADPATETLYVADATELYSGTVSNAPPTVVGNFRLPGDTTNLSFVGLAFGEGKVWGSRSSNSTAAPEGIYLVDPATAEVTLQFAVPSADYDFGGLAYNPDDGLFYGTSDDTSGPGGAGLYSIDIDKGVIDFVTAYPAGETDIDGLAIGDGVAYLTEDESGQSIHPYDLATGMYLTSLTHPSPTNEIFSGAAWIPEPTSLSLLIAGALMLRRRR